MNILSYANLTCKQEIYQYNDVEKTVVCPECQDVIKLGKGSIVNFTTQHLNSRKCQQRKTRRSQPSQPRKKMALPSILGFLRPIAMPVPSLTSTSIPSSSGSSQPSTRVPDYTPLGETTPAALPTLDDTPIANSNEQSSQPTCALARRLKILADTLPVTVPEGQASDKLSVFNSDPRALDNPDIESTDLWEEVLNGMLKGALGWGDELDLTTVIRRGQYGIDGLVHFVDYFVTERGVDEMMFEGKLKHLMDKMEQLHPSSNCSPRIEYSPPPSCDGTPEIEPADVHPVPQGSRAKHQCPGLKLGTPSDHSPHTSYPFALHAHQALPWRYMGSDSGDLYLISHSCKGHTATAPSPCRECASLACLPAVRSILDQMNNGTHKNTPYAYRSHKELVATLRHHQDENQYLRFQALNNTRTILRKSTALSDANCLIVAIGSEDVARIDQVISTALRQKRSIIGILEQVMQAARGAYKVKSFTNQERLLARLLWRIGGDRVGHIMYRAMGLPSVSTVRNGSAQAPIIPCAGKPTAALIARNTMSSLENVVELLLTQKDVQHAVLMIDELACEMRPRYNPLTDEIVGLCREHGPVVSAKLETVEDAEEVFNAMDKGDVHCASNATIGALGILCKESRLYAARTCFISLQCGQETGAQHAADVIEPAVKGINSCKEKHGLRLVSIASDGELRRGLALVLCTFKRRLSSDSNIYQILAPLPLMNLHVGDDDITCDKDWKHIIKRIRNLLLRDWGVLIDDFRITPAVIHAHLQSKHNIKPEHVNSVLNPNDLQDVKLAFNLLHDIWTLPSLSDTPPPASPHTPGYKTGREALRTLGKLLEHIVYAYLGIELSLSEQLEHLSAAGHLAFVLYKLAGKSFFPTQLFIDVMMMIKNVFFCVAKAKVDNPNSWFFIIQLGTDRIEIHFGILRTVVGNDCNLDALQISERTGGVLDIADILAQKPKWDQGPKRLQLPALSQNREPIPDLADHLSPKYLKGDYAVANVTLQTCWRWGRQRAEEDYPPAVAILKEAELKGNIDMLSPSGTLLVTAGAIAADDVDESSEAVALNLRPAATVEAGSSSAVTLAVDNTENRVNVEDEITELEANLRQGPNEQDTAANTPFPRTLLVDGKEMRKSKLLAMLFRYRKTVKSADRLKRVQEITRYTSAEAANTSDFDSGTSLLLIHDPIATLVHSEQHLWLVVGEVNGIRYNGQALDRVGHHLLKESPLKVSFQVLGMRPATSEDDPSGRYDWRTYALPSESLIAPGKFIEPLDPEVVTVDGSKPFFLFQSPLLITTTSLISGRLTSQDSKQLPKLKRTLEFPYRETWGTCLDSQAGVVI
ncbi:hypothetical protein FA13DRAFT_1642094 [Coprinellus micaceus]|uniref:Uncharacterized protein n=1 Tax=Coprinellus micaceus TaxID=71717 RepID=A0A4Y7SJG0_COPMI|nr:hypothetical protein FA13DRAFT_1642094 [Coprinellus micaceus]